MLASATSNQIERSSSAPQSLRVSLISASIGMAVCSWAPAAAAEAPWPTAVQAQYDLRFNGIKIGGFEFNSVVEGNTYRLEGRGSVSVLFGRYKWSGGAESRGTLARAVPRPQSFDFELNGRKKAGTTRMTFDSDNVKSADIQPPPKPPENVLPAQPRHTRNALDPMTMVMALTHGSGNGCQRKAAVFDGTRRVDIWLSPNGTVPLPAQQSADIPTTGLLCRLNYRLVAGHRPGDETSYMNRNQHIELILRPVPSANMFVPHEIRASTLLGSIRAVARTVTITPRGAQQLVLRQ